MLRMEIAAFLSIEEAERRQKEFIYFFIDTEDWLRVINNSMKTIPFTYEDYSIK